MFKECGCELPQNGKAQVLTRAPYRKDENPSLTINLLTGLWDDKAMDGVQGDAFNFWARCHSLDCRAEFSAVLDGIISHFGIPSAGQRGGIPHRDLPISDDAELKAEARDKAASIWDAAHPASNDHPYLRNKGIKANALREHEGSLVVPMTDGRTFHSLQFITRDGKKRFLKGGRTSGCYYLIGEPDGTLCIGEGFATCATIHQATGHAVAVAFNVGNLLPVARSLRERHPDIRLIVGADDDAGTEGNPGVTKAREAADAVDGLLAIPDFGKNRPEGATDFNDLHRHGGLNAVSACIGLAESVAWPEPQPLPDILPEVMPFEPDLLPRVFSAWVKDVAERMQCPLDFPAVGIMVALSAVVGRQIVIRPKAADDWAVVPNLWGGIVSRPGLLKTPALQEVLQPLDRLDARARQDHETAIADHEADKLVAEAQTKIAKDALRKALKNGEDARTIAKAAVESSTQEPSRRRYLVHDPTVEKLGEILRDNPRGVLIFRDELSGFLRNLDREGRESDRAFYLEAWNGTGRFSHDRISRGTIDIEAACVSILGGIQPGPLSAYLSRAFRGGADDDGLVQRFQLVVWPDPSGTWKNIDRPPDAAARREAYGAFERLENIVPASLGAHIPEDGSLPFLRFSPAAQKLFTEWRTALEYRLREDDLPPVIEAHIAKYRSLIPTLALLTHLADGKTGPVDEGSLVRACAWGEFLESHTRRVYAPALSSVLSAAVLVGKRIRGGDLDAEFGVRDIQRKGWSGLTENATISEALELLVSMSLASP